MSISWIEDKESIAAISAVKSESYLVHQRQLDNFSGETRRITVLVFTLLHNSDSSFTRETPLSLSFNKMFAVASSHLFLVNAAAHFDSRDLFEIKLRSFRFI